MNKNEMDENQMNQDQTGDNDFVKSKYMDFYLFAGYKNDYIHKKYVEQSGTFDPFLAEWLIKNVKPGWVVYDVGANMFEVTELSSRLSGPKGLVRAFEPQIDLVNKYIAAQKLNTYENAAPIHVHSFGLGSETKNTKFMVNKDNLGGSTFKESFKDFANSFLDIEWETIECEIKRVDSLALEDEQPDLIKVDIEGGEEDFWSGATDNIKNTPYIIMEMGPYTSKSFFNEVAFGRLCYDIDTMTRVEFSDICSGKQWNVLFVKNEPGSE